MDSSWISLGVAIATILSNIVISYMANKKNIALIEYRLKELEKKQDIHNGIIERVYRLEKDIAVVKEDINNGKGN